MPTVLLIEDDAESRKRIARLFARHGWDTIEAEDGAAGIELAFAQRPDVIVCDLLLPRISGLQVCRAIREKLASPKIIIVAGRTYDIDRERCPGSRWRRLFRQAVKVGKARRGDKTPSPAAPKTDPAPVARS